MASTFGVNIMQSIFYVEITDTYGEDANYSWVKRFKVHASSALGAIRKVSTETGLNFRKEWDTGDLSRYDATQCAVCAFLSGYEDQAEHYSSVKSL
jgi:hypothetical protein